MILNQLLLIPIIGAIIIAVIPVKEMTTAEASAQLSSSTPHLGAGREISNLTDKTEEKTKIETIIKNENIKRTEILKKIALITSIINFIVSIYLWVEFDSSINQYQFVYHFDSLNFCHFNIGIDGISLYFVLLTTFLTPVAIFANFSTLNKNIKYFLISFLLLETLQIAVFVVLDLFLFYIFFESAKWCERSLLCFKLSNSGEALKLMVPNYIWKFISGQNNYLGMVTSHKMTENEMGYRGSKSVKTLTVKEQRVDGSWFLNRLIILNRSLRCTLMGFERNYQVGISSNQINILPFLVKQKGKKIKREIHTFSPQPSSLIPTFANDGKEGTLQYKILAPWFITGFTDGEGCFGLYIYKNKASKMGWYVFLDFKITLHARDRDLLDLIKNYFGKVGVISKHGEQYINYGIRSLKDLQIIINHFDKFPLKTNKLNNYKLFKLAFDIIKNKEHLTKEGLDKLLEIKSFMNKGLSTDLKLAFPYINISPLKIKSEATKIQDPNWLAGFASGEGSFQVDIKTSETLKLGYQILLRFSLAQNSIDEQLLINLRDYLDCGRVQKKKNKKFNTEFFEFRVEKFDDINKKIIPFFIKYPIVGLKSLDFQDFCKVADLINKKAHLTIEGLNQIRRIKEGINRGRTNI